MQKIFKPWASGSPYYDDFDADKNYLALLYNPSRAVQARELTQMGTVAQNQIANLSNYFFKNGSPIIGGRINVTYDVLYMKANAFDSSGQKIDVSTFVGRIFTGQTSGQSILITNADKENNFVFFTYLGSEISDGETFISEVTPAKEFIMMSGSISNAILASCTAGVIYINGYFVNIKEQTIIVATSDLNSEYNIGYLLNEQTITSAEDATLNDPAAGSYNYNAPGADRYNIDISLFSFKTGDSSISDDIFKNFTQGIVIKNKTLILEQSSELNNNLLDILAKRTYDESGSYTVTPWKIYLEEHPSDISKYLVSIQPGEGYIYGYNVKNLISKEIEVSKPRTEIQKPNFSIYINDTSYTYALIDDETMALSAKGVLDFSNFETVEVMSDLNGEGTVLGECNILSLYKEGRRIIIYLANTYQIRNNFSGAKSIRSKLNPSQTWMNLYIDPEYSTAILYGQELPMIFDTGYSPVKGLVNSSVSYETLKKYTTTSESSGNSIYIVDSNSNVDFGTSSTLISIFETDTGKNINIDDAVVIPDNSSTVSSATITSSNIQTSKQYTVIIRVEVKNTSARQKILKTSSITVSVSPDTDIVKLGKEDVFDIISVKANNNVSTENSSFNFKDVLKLDDGQRDYFYDEGSLSGFMNDSVQSKLISKQTTSFTISFRYFEHSGIGAFSANSYVTNINTQTASDITDLYSFIPKYRSNNGKIYNLRDCMDFRIKKSDLSTNNTLYPLQRTEISYGVIKYLPRIDIVWVSKNGEFGITTGIPSESPEPPQSKDGTLNIYYLNNKAYVNDISDVSMQYIDNQRFTMNDIGKMSKRISNVENAVAISQLEQSAIQMQILDEDGMDRYKTGIFTDNLSSFDNSDFTNKEWNCTIDSMEQSLRPQFNCEHRNFTVNENTVQNISLSKPCITLPYTTTVYAENKFASSTKNIQSLMVYIWKGALKLTPSVDTWVNDLGNIPVEETWVDTPQPPTTYRSWTTTNYYTNHRGEDWGFGNNIGKAVETTYTETTEWVSSWIINDTVLKSNRTNDEYMRQIDVKYSCSGLRPNVTIYGTIDNKPLELSNNKTDSEGKIEGFFKIPEKIPCGTKIVKFVDSNSGDETTSDYLTSTAEANYTANGVTIWNDVYRKYIRNYEPVKTVTTTEKTYAWDPIAETFYIEEETGIFLDSIDVFFDTKDEQIGVDLYIVECENGIPTNNKVPFSTVSLSPNEVNIGIDNPTKFKFINPIYLTGKTEYAFILITSSYNYTVYISTLGEKDLTSEKQIIEQPFTGSLLSSQNARTWTPEQLSDIKFTMYKCNFSTDTNGIVEFNIDNTDKEFNVAQMTLVANSFLVKNTEIKYQYKWNTDSIWTEYNNQSDIFLKEEKVIHKKEDDIKSLNLRMTLSTKDRNLSPMIDIEQVYGIFTNNICEESLDIEFPYNCGTYISKPTTLENESSDFRLIIDAILPGKSDVDAYIKTNNYKPLYVEQSSKGDLGVSSLNAEKMIGKTTQVYYYNKTTSKLEPKSQIIITGYDSNTRKVFLRSVGNPDDFKTASGEKDEIYTGLNEKYIHILILPIFSDSDIPFEVWSKKQFNAGDYVIHNGDIWKARVQTLENSTPSDISASWEKIYSIKTSSTTKNDTEIEWRKLKKDEAFMSSVDKESQFLEYTYRPELEFESDYKTFSIKLQLKSKNTVDVPRIKNIRGIATL